MTQEEKAKAYDEAVKRAKAAIDMAADKDLVGGVVRTIFPELAESEDERIRKELIEAFKAYDITSSWNGFPVKSILVWLEKQKEQKPVDYEHEMWKNCEANFEGGKKEVIEHPEKYGLQKPAEWSEEDEKMLRTIISDGSRGVELDSKQISFLKSLRPSWKPSEEQMEALKCALADIARFSKRGGRQVELENEPYYSALHSLYCNLEKLV